MYHNTNVVGALGRAARGDRRRGAGGRRAVPGVLRGRDRQRPDAGRVWAGGGAVPGVVRGGAAWGCWRSRRSTWAAYIRTHPGSVPTVKQHLAAIRALCDWLVVHQVLPVNPAAAVRGPMRVVTKGATPVLTPTEARAILDRIDTGTRVGLRDRALLSVMVYSFARVSAAVGMRRQDYFRQGTRGWLRLHEKGGKRHDVPAHHRAEEAVEAYLAAGGVDDAKAPLFQSVDRAGGLRGARGGPGASGSVPRDRLPGTRENTIMRAVLLTLVVAHLVAGSGGGGRAVPVGAAGVRRGLLRGADVRPLRRRMRRLRTPAGRWSTVSPG